MPNLREGDVVTPFLTPEQVDQERWLWRAWKPQHGGWDTPLWHRVQGDWFAAVRS